MSNDSIFDIMVIPKSSKSGIVLNGKDNIKVYLNSPPVDGKANAELIKILSKELSIAKSKIKIIKGDKGRKKRILIEDLQVDLLKKLSDNR